MKKPNHDRIYLLPEDGIWCWADSPAPGIGQSNDDAVEYVRADLHEQVATQRDSAMSQLETARTAINNNFNQLREHADKTQAQRDNAWQELREIREAIGANPEESTADEVRRVVAERDKALAQVEQLKGIKPELPPFPPQGDGLPRFGIKWNGEYEPISTPMDDGYWTPYHLAAAQNAELADDVEGLTHWRRLALQFDGHRMQAMCMLKLVASGKFDIEEVKTFVAAAPVCGDEHLRDVKAEAVIGAVKYCNHYMAFPVSRGNVADAVISVDELTTYAAGVKAGGV